MVSTIKKWAQKGRILQWRKRERPTPVPLESFRNESPIHSIYDSLDRTIGAQLQELRKIQGAIELMNSAIQQTNFNAESTLIHSNKSSKLAQQSRKVIEQTATAIEDLNRSSLQTIECLERSKGQISKTLDVIRQIGKKAEIIDEISSQAKILSFNASLEATRAGAAGAGFGVVAKEIGALAKMSGQAANEISEMISSSTQEVENILGSCMQSVLQLSTECLHKSQLAGQFVTESKEVPREASEIAEKVATMCFEISTGVQSQILGIQALKDSIKILESKSEELKERQQNLGPQSQINKGGV